MFRSLLEQLNPFNGEGVLLSTINKNGVSSILAFAAAYLAMKLVQFFFERHRAHQTFKRMQIPGPRPNLIHGQLYETRRQPYVRFAHKMHEKYGKNVGIFLGGDPYLITKDLDLIQQVFVAKSRLFFDRMNFYLNVDPVPDNLICQRGERWRYMRKLLTPAFSNAKIKSSQFYHDAHKTAEKFMQQLEANARDVKRQDDGSTTVRLAVVEDVYDRMAAVALDVIVKTAFHMDDVISFDGPLDAPLESTHKQRTLTRAGKVLSRSKRKPQEPVRDAFLQTAKRACRLGFNPLVELIFCFPFLDGPLTFLCNHIYFGSIIKLLFQRLDYLVTRKSHNNNNNISSNNNNNDDANLPKDGDDTQKQGQQQQQQVLSKRKRIIDSLIEVLRERKITKSEFTGNAFVIVFAGFETTANALTFTLWLLAKHQRVQVKLREELRRKMSEINKLMMANENENEEDERNRCDRKLELELGELATGCEYLEMVVNESLRLYPPVPGLSCRQASVTCTLAHNGLTIERGVNVIPSVFSIHRDKSIWGEQAAEFLPERFELLDLNQLNSAMFMPFGLGPRNCIGKAAAMHELKIVIGRLLLNYSIEPSDVGLTPERLKLCSPINITITNSETIGLNFVKLAK